MTVEIILGLFNGYPRYNKTGNRVNEYELIKEKATSLMGEMPRRLVKPQTPPPPVTEF